MILLDVILLIIGILAVVFSFRTIEEEKGKEAAGKEEEGSIDAGSWKEIEEVKEQVSSILEELQQSISEDTKEQLEHLSNEKIIAVTEYGDQVLDKIQKNHSEVVFLYNMLNEKENEIKEVIHGLDKKKAELTDSAAKISYELKVLIKEADSKKSKLSVQDLMNITREPERPVVEKSSFQEVDKRTEATDKKEELPVKKAPAKTETKMEKPEESFKERKTEEKRKVEKEKEPELEKSGIFRLKKETEQNATAKREPENKEELHYFQVPEEKEPEETTNFNDVIVAMYKEGRSILDISRELEIGQGEVKFVIDLYGK